MDVDIVYYILPIIFVYIMVFFVRYFKNRKQGFQMNYIYEVFNFGLFLYFTCLISVTLFPLSYDPYSTVEVHYVPFKNMYEYYIHISLGIFIKNTLGNILLFIPFGLLVPIRWEKVSTIARCWLLGTSLSILIELTQLLMGILKLSSRACEIDDIILNSLGVLCGYGIYKIILRFRKKGGKLDQILASVRKVEHSPLSRDEKDEVDSKRCE